MHYTVNEVGDLVAGSKTEPVKFQEQWTFTYSVGGNVLKLSVITQAQ